jgi:shikimate 5-dehydrogenase
VNGVVSEGEEWMGMNFDGWGIRRGLAIKLESVSVWVVGIWQS